MNKRFYRELQHWYFWALGHVRFPDGAPKDAEDHDSLSLIRLLTRLIFVWFLKEKGLVPENLFDARVLPKLLKGFAPASQKDKDSVYYRAVLQNLFFATLNCEPDQRAWAREGQNMMAHSLYRFREDFASATTALDLFKDIPFLNGGLFECLDKDLGEGAKPRYVRIDGFSRRDDSQPVVPDFLFFGPEQDTDLSDFYEEKPSGKKARPVRVRGLLEIFHDFKFTIEENTPLEEDVALDPELLGRVFENLLAAYNPETQGTARKQTGSFYTPREIVDHMTGQALFYALREKVSELPGIDTRLQSALAHDDTPNPFNSAETAELIAALDDLKILDPACGSGAFPMGVLHRLVHLLQKLDPGNTRWKKRQLDKAAELPDHDIRELVTADIEEAFARNELGYGRKLYLIENCLYGVDIQPIAAQITKLRFFISLIVEQRTDPAAPNRGIRPLPNLETKIVAANTLLGIARPGQQMLRNFEIDDKEAELRHVRDDHFLARTPKKKAKCREDDARLRKEIATLLKDDGWDSATAKRLSAWDPYDQNTHADFFDNEWMFGLTDGFDIVIGNPPYVRPHKLSSEFKEILWRTYGTFEKKADLYVCFIELAVKLLSSGGTVSFIASNGFMRLDSFEALRKFLLRETSIRSLIDFEEDVFESAAVKTCVLVLSRRKEPHGIVHCARPKAAIDLVNLITRPIPQEAFEKTYMSIFDLSTGSALDQVKDKMRTDAITVSEHFDISFGLKTGDDDRFLSKRASTRQHKRLLRGENVGRYFTEFAEEYVRYVPDEMTSHRRTARPGTADRFEQPKVLVRDTGAGLCCTFDGDSYYVKDVLVVSHSSKSAPLLKKLTAVLNSKLLRFYYETSFPTLHVQRNELGSLPLRPEMLPTNACRELPTLVDQILAAKRADAGADTSVLEAEIDRHVYALYGLTPAEIQLVEESSARTT